MLLGRPARPAADPRLLHHPAVPDQPGHRARRHRHLPRAGRARPAAQPGAERWWPRRSCCARRTAPPTACWRRLGLPKLPVFVLDSAVLADRLIVPTIPEFEYHRSDLPGHVRFVGAVSPLPTRRLRRPAVVGRAAQRPPGRARHPGHHRQRRPQPADRTDHRGARRRGRHGGGHHRRPPRLPDPVPLPANTFVAEYHPARRAAADGRRHGHQRRLRRRAARAVRRACRWWSRATPRTSRRWPRGSNSSARASTCAPARRPPPRCAARCATCWATPPYRDRPPPAEGIRASATASPRSLPVDEVVAERWMGAACLRNWPCRHRGSGLLWPGGGR